MSTYTACEIALLARIHDFRSGATFGPDNATRGDFRALDAKGRGVACVLLQAARSEYGDTLGGGRGAHGKRQQRHQIGATVFVARGTGAGGDGAAYQALTEIVDALVAWLDTFPRLSNAPGVKRAEVVEVGDARTRETRPWVWQTLRVTVLTETEPVLTEGAQ